MYLATQQAKGKTNYIIRQSYLCSGQYKKRDLFYIGPDPTIFIHYPGGNSYYYDDCIEETLSSKGVEFNSSDLDRIFFKFINPEIQRVVTGFDRTFQATSTLPHDLENKDSIPIHFFDKRRYHYLRFGHSRQEFIHNAPEKIFRPLQNKSRDELEFYFDSEENKLKHYEVGPYLATIFQLTAFTPDSQEHLLNQLDSYFINRLCQLNSDSLFLAGEPKRRFLFEHLIKYAIIYFDNPPIQHNTRWQQIIDFMNQHRTYRPPLKTQSMIQEAEKLFGHEWKVLKRMDRNTLTRLFRKLALKHHPDQGGSGETFCRLTQTYRVLLERNQKA